MLDMAVGVRRTAAEQAAASLIVEAALDILQEDTYAATVAGLSYELLVTRRGYALTVEGFSHKLGSLALRIVGALTSIAAGACTDAVYARCAQAVSLRLENAGHTAEERARQIRLAALEAPHFSSDARLAAISSDLDVQIVAERAAAEICGPRIYLSGYANGNLSGDEATELFMEAARLLRLSDGSPLAAHMHAAAALAAATHAAAAAAATAAVTILSSPGGRGSQRQR